MYLKNILGVLYYNCDVLLRFRVRIHGLYRGRAAWGERS